MEVLHDKEREIVSINGSEFTELYILSTLLPSEDDIGTTFRIAKIGGMIMRVRVIPRTLLGSYKTALGMKWLTFFSLGGLGFFLKSPMLTGLAIGGLIVYGAAALVISAIGAASDYCISEVKFLPKDEATR